MKLRATPQHSFHHDDSLQIKAVEEATSPAFVGICVGSVFLVVTLAAVSCVCYRRRSAVKLQGSQRRGQGVDKNLPLKKSPAVRSPSSGPAGPILKKSPSPTGTKSPLGQKSPSSQAADDSGSVGSGAVDPDSSHGSSVADFNDMHLQSMESDEGF
ncbi:putative synaptotagmin [Ixodes scapularis]